MSGISFDTPSEPCRCIARNAMSVSTLGVITFTAAISLRAFAPPTWSITHAACSTMSRNWCSSIHESATYSCTICFFASSAPCVERDSTRSPIMSIARWHIPTVRIAWWMRPPPRRVCAITNAWPGPPSTFSSGTRTSR